MKAIGARVKPLTFSVVKEECKKRESEPHSNTTEIKVSTLLESEVSENHFRFKAAVNLLNCIHFKIISGM